MMPRSSMSSWLSDLIVFGGACVVWAGAAHGGDADSLAVPAPIENSVTLDVSIEEAWSAWTTSEGVDDWLSPQAEIEPRPRGKFHAIYRPEEGDLLERGSIGEVVALEPNRMLVLTWMTPLPMEDLRGNSTVLIAHFHELGPKRTRIDIVNTGYGRGPRWRAAYEYNVKGWDRILSTLEHRFRTGPIDWDAYVREVRTTGTVSYWRENRE